MSPTTSAVQYLFFGSQITCTCTLSTKKQIRCPIYPYLHSHVHPLLPKSVKESRIRLSTRHYTCLQFVTGFCSARKTVIDSLKLGVVWSNVCLCLQFLLLTSFPTVGGFDVRGTCLCRTERALVGFDIRSTSGRASRFVGVCITQKIDHFLSFVLIVRR